MSKNTETIDITKFRSKFIQ